MGDKKLIRKNRKNGGVNEHLVTSTTRYIKTEEDRFVIHNFIKVSIRE